MKQEAPTSVSRGSSLYIMHKNHSCVENNIDKKKVEVCPVPLLSLLDKLELNKIAARWPAKAVAQFFLLFSKIGSDRIVPR